MNCKCLNDIEKRVSDNFEFPDPVKSIRIMPQDVALVKSGKKVRTCSYVKVAFKGRRKDEYVPLLHDYCPFCGTPQGTGAVASGN